MTGRLPRTMRPFLSTSKRMTTLGSRHSTRNFFRFRLPLTRICLHDGSHSDPAAVDPDRDALARELAAGRKFATPEPHQVAGAGGQHLRPQLTSDSPHRFLVLFQAPPSQLRACLFDWQQTDQTTHLGLHVGAATLTDPISRQFRVEPASLDASPLAGAPTRRAVQRHHRDRQATQKPDHQGASFFSTGRSGTSAASITLSMCGAVSGLLAGLGQQPGDVEIGLPPRLLVNLEFHGGEAGRVGGQTFEPLAFALGQ